MKFIYLILNWIFGVLFMLVGVASLVESPLGGFCMIVIAVLLLPPVRNFVYSKTNKALSVKARAISVFVLFIAFGVFVGQSQDKKAQELATQQVQEKSEKAVQIRQEKIDYFNANREQIILDVKVSLTAKEYQSVLSQSAKYLVTDDKELTQMYTSAKTELVKIKQAELTEKKQLAEIEEVKQAEIRKAELAEKQRLAEIEKAEKTKNLLAELKKVPVEQYEKNLNLYQQLVVISPNNQDYKKKRNYYQNKITEQQEKDSEKSTPKRNEIQEKKEVVSTLSFRKIRKNLKSMTDIQFEEYAKSLKGKRVRWKGYVEDVTEKFFGGYKVLVDMDSPNDPISVQDVTFDVSKEQAISLTKDDKIEFEGTISLVFSMLTSLQISLDKANVVK
ncbi:MAG: hypothetical protein DRQ49_18010 [Gammaproteobacteria bacterium]|nr:MAG: hypothetical protein DRQ49_18010 [Gammaproteobacteria bacterium]